MTGAPRRGSQHLRRSSLPRALTTSLHAMMASVLTWSKGKNNKRILYKKKNTQKLPLLYTVHTNIGMSFRCDQTSNCLDESDEDFCRMIFQKENYKKTIPPFRKELI